MLAIAKALTWEYCKRGWFAVVWALAYLIGFPVLVAGVWAASGIDYSPEAVSTVALHYMFLIVGSVGFYFVVLVAQHDRNLGFLTHHHTLPVSTWLLVAHKTIQGMLTMFLLYLALAHSYELLFGIVWPLWGPAMFLATAMVWVHACYWSLMDFRFWKLAASCIAAAILGFWLDARYVNEGFNEPGTMWTVVTAGEVLTMMIATTVGYVLSVRAVARLRCGGADGLARVRAWNESFTDFVLRQRDHQFPSPEAAQFSSEWWQKGIAMPAALAVVLVTVLIVIVVRVQLGWSLLSDCLQVFVGLTILFVCCLPWAFGVFLGQVDLSKQGLGFTGFTGTLPVSDAFLSRSILRAGACSLLSLAAICTILVGIACGWVIAVDGLDAIRSGFGIEYFRAQWPKLTPVADLLGNFSYFSIGVFSLLIGWIGIGNTMSLTMMGRSWVGSLTAGLLVVFALIWSPLAHLIFADFFDAFRFATALVLGCACVFGMLMAFVTAHRRRHISTRTVWISATVWLVSCSILVWFWASVEASDSWYMLLALGSLALSIAPVATAPLAVSWNRRR